MINEKSLITLAKNAKKTAHHLAQLTTTEKNMALRTMAKHLRSAAADILAVNAKDISEAKQNGRSDSFIERLTLTPERVEAMANGLEQVATLPDIIGQTDSQWLTDTDLQISKVRVPLGVIGIIYESRPNVTTDASALAFKSGNAVILRGGKETIHSNTEIVQVLQAALKEVNLPITAINYIDNPDRELAKQFMHLNEYVDCLIPRGSAGLIQNVIQQATIPTIETGTGNNHLYIHKDADIEKALAILENAKTQRVSVCNAIETLLVDKEIAEEFLSLAASLLARYHVKIHADNIASNYFQNSIAITPDDDATEYLDYELAIRVVEDVNTAIEHIMTYSTHHTETIVTENYSTARLFTQAIDSAVVMVNASSRFSDGEQFGFGGEIGISTQKLHARGPMGLAALTSYKYIVLGDGQTRD